MPVISVTISRNLLLRGRRFQFNKSDRIKPILIIIPIQALPARRTGNYMVEVYRQSRKINHFDLIYDTVFKMHIDPAIVGISLRQCKFRGLFPRFKPPGSPGLPEMLGDLTIRRNRLTVRAYFNRYGHRNRCRNRQDRFFHTQINKIA